MVRTARLFLTLTILTSFTWISGCCPPEVTEGYIQFTGKTEGLPISFEYPAIYGNFGLEKLGTLEKLGLYDCHTARISISSDMNTANGGDYENAHARLMHELDIASNVPEFQLIKQSERAIAGISGEELIYSVNLESSVDIIPPIGKMTYRLVVADYKGRIYSISIFVDADKYDDVKEGFEHLLATFKFQE